MSSRVLICGSRNWTDVRYIERYIDQLSRETVIIHGDQMGADQIAAVCAEKRGMSIEAYPADWATHGRAAGPIRNQMMLDVGKPDWVVAYTYSIWDSKGTKDMVTRALHTGLAVEYNSYHIRNPRPVFKMAENGALFIGVA